MKKLVAIAGFCIISIVAYADCIDFANNVAAYYHQDVSTSSGFTFWQNFYNACVETYE